MNIKILEARARRNGLEKYAGKHFRGSDSELVKVLNEEGKKVLFGIQKAKGKYTVLGDNKVYFLTPKGIKGAIELKAFSELLHLEAMRKGKRSKFKYLAIDPNQKIWLYNRLTMTALWNILLYLESQKMEKTDE